MALSDCEKCWETPCSCGWGYRHYSDDQFAHFIADILTYKDNKLQILENAKKIIEYRL